MEDKTKLIILITASAFFWLGTLAVIFNSSTKTCDSCEIEFKNNLGQTISEKVLVLKQNFEENKCVIRYDKTVGVVRNYDINQG